MADQPGPARDSPRIGRRGFIGAGLTTVGAALVLPGAARAGDRITSGTAAHTPAPNVPPDVFSLVPIPPGRVDAAVDALDGIIRRALATTGVPGLAAAVVYNGRLRYARGFGVRDVNTGDPVRASTVFRLASVSKSLAATVVAGVVGDKLAQWTDPLTKYLPTFALSDPYVTDHVTIQDMLTHRSGLPPAAGDLLEDLGYKQSYILDRLRLEPLVPFRTEHNYSNFGYTSGAAAAAAAAGKGWADLADDVLFHRLAMTSSSYRFSDFERRANKAAMHVRVNGEWVQAYNRNADQEAPAGGASSNVLDLARWMMLELAGGKWNKRPLIDAAALAATRLPLSIANPPLTPASRTGFYGLGTGVGYDYAGRLRLSHSGAFLQGVATTHVLLPSDNLGIVVVTNGMPIGVPEAVGNYFLDLVEAGSIQEDWLTIYTKAFAGLYVNPSVLAGKTPPHHPRPAGPHSFYVGTYDNDFYGPIRIVVKQGTLHMLIGPTPLDYPLTHWDGNRFSFFPTGENAVGITAATFHPDVSNIHADSVTLEYYDTTHLGTFSRASH